MKMDKLRVGYACLARLTFDEAYARNLFRRSLDALSQLGVELIHAPDLTVTEEDGLAVADRFHQERADVVLIQYGTFALGTLMPILADRLRQPLVLWGVPEPSLDGPKLQSNSLCGLNMNVHTLMRLGRPYDYIFCQPEEAVQELRPRLRVLECLTRLRTARIGLVGYRAPGFYTSTFDELGLRKSLGVEVHHLTLAEVFHEAKNVDATRRRQEAEALRSKATLCEVEARELEEASAVAVAFGDLAAKYRLDAFAVKCWPEFAGIHGVAACSALSRMSDQGILAGCEGDVYGTVTMLIERYLTGQTPMFADFIAIEEPGNLGFCWHCGAAPPCLAERGVPVGLGRHPTIDGGNKKGVTLNFPVRGEGPVTMARLGVGPDGPRLFFAGGQAVPCQKKTRGNMLAVRFDHPVRALVDRILSTGMEHHYAVVHADVRPELRRLARWLGLPTLDIDGGA